MKRFVAALTVLSFCWLAMVSGEDIFMSYLALGTLIASVVLGVVLLVRRRWKWLGVFAGVFAVLGLLGSTGVVSGLRLKLSEGGIESAGRDVLDGRSPGWAGLYAVEASWETPSGCAVLVTHTVLIDDEGFLYCPRGSDSYGFPKLGDSVYEYSS